RGFAMGDRCALLMQNQARWLISATGALWSGAVLVPLDYKLTAPEQVSLLAHAKPRVLVTDYSIWQRMRRDDRAADVFEGITVYVVGAPAEAAKTLAPARAYELPEASDGFTYTEPAREDVACIVYSSGTGGTPKGCLLTHHNYLSQAEVLGNLHPMAEGDRYFSVLPTNHAIDFMCGFCLPLTMGGAVVHQMTLRKEFLGATMQRYGVTHIALVPRLLKALKEKIEEKLDELSSWKRAIVDRLIAVNEMATLRGPNHKLSSTLLRPIHDGFGGKLKLIFAGGAFCEREVSEFFNRLGFPVAIGYGLTEACTVLTVNDLKPFRADSVGAPIEGVELELRDKNAAGIGEVWVKSATVMKGYLDEPELTAEAIVDGWLRTGDLGTIDASGHLSLVGRAKNMIVTEGGKNVYPEDIEAAFGDLNDCEESCVYAANYIWPSNKMVGETLVLVLRVTKEHGGKVPESVLNTLRRRNRKLSDFKRLSGIVVWSEEFPRTASLKIKRQVLAGEIRNTLAREAAIQAL
ncbi:MAG: AMP-binding protein, partial [Nannocystaceae bacterium]